MPQYFIEKDGKYSSLPPPSLLKDIFLGVVIYLFSLLLAIACHENIFPFEIVLWGKFKGNLWYREVPLVEILPPTVSTDRVLVLGAPLVCYE